MIYDNKMKNFNLNENNMFTVIDFDRTITSEDGVDSWDASGKMLGEEFKKELTELYLKYEPIERDYSMVFEEKEKAMEEWYSQCMKLYYKYNLTREKIEKSTDESNLIFRKGAKEFLENMYEKNIPVIIMSAGIGNVIERFLKKNNCFFDNIFIISNFIEFDKEGNMKVFDDEKMIHSLNKTIEHHLPVDMETNVSNRKYKILIGDLIEDLKMVDEKEVDSTKRICFINNRTEKDINKFRRNFDIVLTQEDANFNNVEKIIGNI